MKRIINISEDVYTRLFDNGIQDNEIAIDDICEMARAIRLGTPLPKGHGRLIDADKLYDQFEYADYDFEKTLEYAPTIIEAESEDA